MSLRPAKSASTDHSATKPTGDSAGGPRRGSRARCDELRGPFSCAMQGVAGLRFRSDARIYRKSSMNSLFLYSVMRAESLTLRFASGW